MNPLTGLLLLCFSLAAMPLPHFAEECRVDVSGEMDLSAPSCSSGASCGYMPWLSGTAAKRNLIVRMRQEKEEWRKLEFSFIAAASGKVRIMLRGQFVRQNGVIVPVFSCYDDVCVNGIPLKNGNFESGLEEWERISATPDLPAAVQRDQGGKGSSFAVAWHNGGLVRTISVRQNEKITISFSFRGYPDPLQNRHAAEDEFLHRTPEWMAADIPDAGVLPGSVLDLSSFTQGRTAGESGRAIVSERGTVAFEKRPDEDVRFLGFNWFGFEWMYTKDKAELRKRIDLFAERMQLQGYNVLRPLSLDRYLYIGADRDIEIRPENLNDADYLLAALKKRGIYLFLTLAGYQPGYHDRARAMKERNNIKLKILTGDLDARAHWAGMVRTLLNHVNPYTGTAWKEEPAILAVEFYNEQDFGMSQRRDASAEALESLNRSWRTWLRKRYGTIVRLNAEWERDYETFDVPVYPAELDGVSPESRDALLFHKELCRETCAWYVSVVREAGYAGLVSQFSLMKNLFGGEVRKEMLDVVVQNGYFRHPSKDMAPGSEVNQESSVAGGCLYLRNMASVRLADRPLFITEYNHSFWNRHQHECGVAAPSFASLQNFSALMVHEGAATVFPMAPLGCFSAAFSPVVRANEFLSAAIFLRGDVRASEKRIELVYEDEFLRKGKNAFGAADSVLNKLSLLGAFSVSFPDVPAGNRVRHVTLAEPVLRVFPESSSVIRTSDWFTEVRQETSSEQALHKAVHALRKKGILSPSNKTSPENAVFHSETEEILYRCREQMIKVATPRTEAVSLSPGQSERLKYLNVSTVSVPATVALISMDGKELSESRRMVLIFSTTAANSGMRLSRDRKIMKEPGTLPILLETGTLKAEILRKNPPAFHLYPLSLNGIRRRRLTLQAKMDGYEIEINTAALENGPTVFFELTAE